MTKNRKMHTVYCDLKMTRRQTICQVLDVHNTLIYNADTLDACLVWAFDSGETKIRVNTGRKWFELDLTKQMWDASERSGPKLAR